ncbi:hypothetical protein GS636_06875 [Ruegeria sp. HKCCD4884]|uniref:hypothetical protein n=1 Tax=Ruegeria sp. HKCCD4884 TaxID=2683022 RepID=UPI001491E878|nr:hypothetical protein [Ruegeria sp. HKCCD4884]NOD92504.1 hypothetical protein [Ruegeria sp. HKCCD4884]
MNELSSVATDTAFPKEHPNDEFDVQLCRGREVLSLDELQRAKLLKEAVRHWRLKGFPYSRYSKEDAHVAALNFRKSLQEKSPQELLESRSTLGLGLANSYHPQMWSVKGYGRNKSPIDYFNDDDSLKKALSRAPRFWPNRHCWNENSVRSLFRIMGPGRVANFRPTVAAGVIKRFCPERGRVVDFSSGFSGRLLAALSLGVNYLGIDAAVSQCSGGQKMISDIGAINRERTEIRHGCATRVMRELDPSSVDLVFTSPPYFDRERYSEDHLQSIIQFPTYGSWFDGFLKTCIELSFKKLRAGGTLVLNVGNSARYPLATDTVETMRRVFGNVEVFELSMRRLPSYQHFSSSFRSEVIVSSVKQSVDQ